MDKIVGFIGCGNMASAMIGGIVNSRLLPKERIIASNRSKEKLEKIHDKYGINTTNDNKEVASHSDILVLSVKPNMYSSVVDEIKNVVKENVIVITIAPGIGIRDMQNMFEKDIKVVRAMPNTPALVGEGMSALCPSVNVSKEELLDVMNIFESFGKAEVVDEKLIDAVIAVSGSSPAYVYMFIEAMADAAVLEGMPRDKAYKFAAQAVLGSAKMVLETGLHPGELKDMVCSPEGTTIEAVATLEDKGFRSAVISAMKSCTEKSRKMTK